MPKANGIRNNSTLKFSFLGGLNLTVIQLHKIKRTCIASLVFSIYSIIIGLPVSILLIGESVFQANFYGSDGFGAILIFFIKLAQFFLDNDPMLATAVVFILSLTSFILGRSAWKRVKEADLLEEMDLPDIANFFCIFAFIIGCLNVLIYIVIFIIFF